jgi:hypothetical protein
LKRESIIASVQHWLDAIVIGLNLCPFAKRELVKNRVRFFVSEADTEELLLDDLQSELEFLVHNDAVETTLLIHPDVLQDFYEYNQFLAYSDELLEQMELDGIYQIASFHPQYQFDGSQVDDVDNFTNRSPYPLLHILREDSLERAIARHPESSQIGEHNIELLRRLGRKKVEALFQTCFAGK